jgi:hypothetical protein
MRTCAIGIIAVLLHGAGLSTVGAQDASSLRIVFQAKTGRQDGGDRLSGGSFIDPAAIGKTFTLAMSRLAGQCGMSFGHQPLGDVGETHDGSMKKVQSAWTIHATPVRQAGEAVTVRVQWMRSRDNGRPSAVGRDTELTLRPGQWLTLDVMPQADEAAAACLSMSLAAGVVHWPEPERDRRLLAVELWLVERLPDGKERSQPLSLRGLYNQAIPFHFGTLSAGTKMLDVFGDLQISPGDAMGIKITTRSRVIDSAPYPQPRPRDYPEEEPWPPLYVGSTNATLKIDPGEVVSVPLPPVGRGGADAEAFAARALSFRLRVRQIR